MNTQKSLTEQVNEVLNQRISAKKKEEALIKLGVTPYEAMCLAKASMPVRPRIPRTVFAYTFGVEMETIHCNRYDFIDAANRRGLAVIDHLSQYSGCHTDIPQFKLVPDSSISGSQPAECVTPALRSTDGFASLKNCCEALNAIGARVNSSCGLHVHIGAAGLTPKEYANVFVNYAHLEGVIDTFMATSRRGNNCHWCKSLKPYKRELEICSDHDTIGSVLNCNRYFKVNPCSFARHRTIEFRQHQGSVNYRKIAAWIKFLGKLVEWSRNNRLTQDVTSIDEVPFLSAAEKTFFKNRANQLSRV